MPCFLEPAAKGMRYPLRKKLTAACTNYGERVWGHHARLVMRVQRAMSMKRTWERIDEGDNTLGLPVSENIKIIMPCI